jgi:aspartate carbamoyltransferase catalytic subunit
MKLGHVIESQQFDRTDLEQLFECARQMEIVVSRGGSNLLAGKIMISYFHEESTRTRFSFEAAMRRLGGGVISSENALQFSSAAKGESLRDSIQVIGGYGDIIVLRHGSEGAAESAAQVSSVPLINAGDGPGQHPTQALLDIYTIEKEFGKIDGLTIAMIGDLADGRTVHSLAYLLTKFRNIKIIFVSPPAMRMKDKIKTYLDKCGVPWEENADLNEVARIADVLYQTRIQTERRQRKLADRLEKAAVKYTIDAKTLKLMSPRARIMHPFPRKKEISRDVDSDPRAAYFRQAHNGLYLRMALLKAILAPNAKIE